MSTTGGSRAPVDPVRRRVGLVGEEADPGALVEQRRETSATRGAGVAAAACSAACRPGRPGRRRSRRVGAGQVHRLAGSSSQSQTPPRVDPAQHRPRRVRALGVPWRARGRPARRRRASKAPNHAQRQVDVVGAGRRSRPGRRTGGDQLAELEEPQCARATSAVRRRAGPSPRPDPAAGSAPLTAEQPPRRARAGRAPARGRPRPASAARTSGCGANGAVRIADPDDLAVASRTTTHHCGCVGRGRHAARRPAARVGHRGDHRGEHRVGARCVAGGGQERGGIVGELQRRTHRPRHGYARPAAVPARQPVSGGARARPRISPMTETQHAQAPDTTTHRPARRRRTGQAGARGPRGQVGGALEGRRHLRLRPHPAARERLLDRHPAADRQRQPARRARLLLHPHRPDRPLPADARQVGLLPDGLGRQRPADRAPGAELLRRPLRPVAALRRRLHPAGEARPEEAGPDQPAQLHRAVRASWSSEDEEVFESLWRTLGLSVDWTQHYTTIGAEGPDRQPARVPAQLRPRRGLPRRRRRPSGTSPSRPRSPRPSSRPASTPAPTTGSPSTGPTAPRSTSRPPVPS